MADGGLRAHQVADLPDKRRRFWQLAGPGAVLVGLSIGAGEIVIWPLIVAKYGHTMIWAAIVGIFLQLWINFEVGRWTIATVESVYTGYCRVWRGFAIIFIMLNICSWVAPGWGRTSGLALKALTVGPHGFGSDTFWTVLTFGFVALILFGPKLVYRSVERTVEVLVVIVTVGLIVVAVAVGTLETWGDLLRGAINVPYRDPDMPVKLFFIALVFAGAGGTGNLFYSFYLRDKQIGMSARVPTMRNYLRERSEAVPTTGYVFPDTAENRSRFRRWFNYVRTEQVLFFWFLNTLTMLLFIFASLAVLRPLGIVPAKGTLIWDEAAILGEIWGQAGRTIFLIIGVATLFSTQLAVVDGVGRSLADIIYTNFPRSRRRDVSWWYMLVTALFILSGCVITGVMEKLGVSELGFLFNAAYIGGFSMAIYCPLTLYINLRYLPPSARPGVVHTVCMGIASCVYIGFAVVCCVM